MIFTEGKKLRSFGYERATSNEVKLYVEFLTRKGAYHERLHLTHSLPRDILQL
jgi:hypothetical protein